MEIGVLKKIMYGLLSMFLVFIFTEPLIRIVYLVAGWNQLTLTTPFISGTKFFALSIVVVILAGKYMKLTPIAERGKKPLLLLLSVGLLTTTVWFTTTNENSITVQKLLHHKSHTWDEVDYVKTGLITNRTITVFGKEIEYRRTDGVGKNRRSRGRGKVIPLYEYRVFFKDGSSVNVWDNIDSLYKLHTFVKEKDIKVVHGEVHLKENNLRSYIKGDVEKAKEILGFTDIKDDQEKD